MTIDRHYIYIDYVGVVNATQQRLACCFSRYRPPFSPSTWLTCLRVVPVSRLSSRCSLLRCYPLCRRSPGQLQALSLCVRAVTCYATSSSASSRPVSRGRHGRLPVATCGRTDGQRAHSSHGHRRRLLRLHHRLGSSPERCSRGYLFHQWITNDTLLLHS